MNSVIKKHWPLVSTLVIYLATVAVLLILSIRKNHGYFIYPLDDTYIHMSIAKNFALHRIWGVTKFEFTSATSSPLWTFLVYLTYLIFGINEVSPLALNISENSHIVLLLLASLIILFILYRKKGKIFDEKILLLIIFIAITLLYVQFARFGWLYRYEAYIVLLGIMSLGTIIGSIIPGKFTLKSVGESLPEYVIAALFTVVFCSPFIYRYLNSLRQIPQAAHDRYLEHVQPTKFISRYYNSASVIVSDIGAATFFTDARILDIYGLGNKEPIIFRKKNNGYSKLDVYEWAKKNDTKLFYSNNPVVQRPFKKTLFFAKNY